MATQNKNNTANAVRPHYITQVNMFHRWLDTHYLPPNARLLWFMLIDLCNSCGWAEWFQADTKRLMRWIDASDARAAYRARDALVAAGLLEYQRGHKGCPNRYRMQFFPEKNGGTEYGTQNSTIHGTQNCTQNSTQSAPKAVHINRDKIENKTKTKRENTVSAEADTRAPVRTDYQQITDAFNRICTSLPQVQSVSDKRRQAIRTASQTVGDIAGWEKLFRTVEQSDFLTGRNGSWQGCGFDWILKPANLVKILEGNYTDKPDRKEADFHDDRISFGTML